MGSPQPQVLPVVASSAEQNRGNETFSRSVSPAVQSEAGDDASGGVQKLQTALDQGKTWARIVANKPGLQQHEVETLNTRGVVAVPDEVLGDKPLWNDLLVGQFLTTSPHVAKVHVIVNKIWPLGDKTVKIDVFVVSSTMMKFRIRDEAVRTRVLRRGMWNIADILMLVSKWTPILEESQQEITKTPMWITIKKVPHSMFSWKGLGFLASKVGEPKRLHPETEICKSFEEAKVLVEVNLMKELPKTFEFEIEPGKDEVVEFFYPWLPPKCGTCSRWGHFQEGCKVSPPTISILKRNDNPGKSQQTTDIQHDSPKSTKTQESVEKDLELTPQGMRLVGPSSTGKQSEKISEKTTKQSWIPISPNKAGRLKEQCSSSPITSTPSRFSVLGEDEMTALIAESDKASKPELTEGRTNWEEGEIRGDMLEKAQIQEIEEGNVQHEIVSTNESDDVVANDETGLRLSLKRASKTAHRVLAETQPQRNTHSKNQASRANKKKN